MKIVTNLYKAMVNRLMLLMESRIHGDMYVRFGGRLVETYHRKMARRHLPSLLIYWNFSIKDKEGRKITLDQYRALSKEEQERYKVNPFHENLQRIQRASDQPARNTPGEMGIL